MHKVEVRYDRERGCGWRKAGGLYLISGGVSAPCGLLPIELTTCPTCNCGIRQNRGWTWIDPVALRAGKPCRLNGSARHLFRGRAIDDMCEGCPLNTITGRHGLLWIGAGYYKKPGDWTDEAIRQGVSRRIQAVPNDFVLGTTWVFVAHGEVSRTGCKPCLGSGKQFLPNSEIIMPGSPDCPECKGRGSVPQAAIFHAFKPSSIEYVVTGDESDEDLDRLIKRGITPVHVEHAGGDTEAAEEDLTLVEAEG